MQVVGTVDGGDALVITTSITAGVGVIDLGYGMEGLMDVTNVVNDETQGEGAGIGLVGEVRLNGLVVVAALVCSSIVSEPLGKRFKCVENFVLIFNEGEV